MRFFSEWQRNRDAICDTKEENYFFRVLEYSNEWNESCTWDFVNSSLIEDEEESERSQLLIIATIEYVPHLELQLHSFLSIFKRGRSAKDEKRISERISQRDRSK